MKTNTRSIARRGLLALSIVAGAMDLRCAESDSLKADFSSPTKAQRPFIRWWWPGGDVEPAVFAGQLDTFAAAGFGGVEIQPFVIGLPPGLVRSSGVGDRINDYATPRFFAHVAAVAKRAGELDLTVDYTLGSAWPSGGVPEVTPALAQRELSVSWQSVKGPAAFTGAIQPPGRAERLGTMMDRMTGGPDPELARQLQAEEKVVAVLAYRGTAPRTKAHTSMFGITDPDGVVEESGRLDPGSVVVLTDQVQADGTLDWEAPEGEWQVLVFKSFVADIRVGAAAGRGTKFVLDHLNRRAFETYAHRVFGGGEEQLRDYLGGPLRALFVDSLELEVDTYWSDAFLAEFERRRGYDLVPWLPAIVVPGWENSYLSYPSAPLFELGEAGQRIREDFRLTVSDVMLENFYQPLEDYAQRHGMISRVQVHGAPVDLIRGYGIASIPEMETMSPLTRERDVNLLLARSAANIYGRRLTAAESMVWKENPFLPTPERWKRRADLLFTLGVNQLVYHGAPYPYANDTRPGWHPFTAPYDFSSFFSSDHPVWPFLGPLNGYVARLQAVLQGSAPVVPVAIYRQALSAGPLGHPAQEQALADQLVDAGYLTDLINADGLLRASIANGRLVTPGGTAYAAIVLPTVSALRVEAAEKLASAAVAGVPVMFTEAVPRRAEGWLQPEHSDARVKVAIETVLEASAGRLIAPSELVATLGDRNVQPNVRFRDGQSLPFIEKRSGERRFFFFYNPDDSERTTVIEVAGASAMERWDAWTGAISAFPAEPVTDGVRATLELAPGESALLATSNAPASPRATRRVFTDKRVLSLTDTRWHFVATGYGRDGRDVKVEKSGIELADWGTMDAVKDLAGTGVYTTTFRLDADALTTGTRVLLELGAVHDLAVVSINSRPAHTVLLRPFTLDITADVRSGENTLQVTVANSPNNAMVGRNLAPPQPGLPAASYTPLPAGLLGPVRIRVQASTP